MSSSTTASPAIPLNPSHSHLSRFVGSLPLPPTLPLTPTIPIPVQQLSEPTVAMSEPVQSPPRVAADSMSYFPPFECMGSYVPDGEEEEEAEEAGPSQPREEPGHGKRRSLGSLAGIISFFSPGNELPPTASDGQALHALARKVNPAKRRVLACVTFSSNAELADVEDVQELKRRACGEEKMAKRVRDSGTESAEESVKESAEEGPKESPKEGATESGRQGGIAESGSHQPLTTPFRASRRQKPDLSLSSLPQWRFPMPSPPVTSLSADIPLSAFSPIENPASNPSSTESSPSKPITPSLFFLSHRYDNNYSRDFSPTGSNFGTLSSTSSRPMTPRDEWFPLPKSPNGFESQRLYARLERSVSQASCDSKETIKASM